MKAINSSIKAYTENLAGMNKRDKKLLDDLLSNLVDLFPNYRIAMETKDIIKFDGTNSNGIYDKNLVETIRIHLSALEKEDFNLEEYIHAREIVQKGKSYTNDDC